MQQSLGARCLYLVDYAVMRGLHCRPGRVMVAPLALFFYTDKRQLQPLAIHLDPVNSNRRSVSLVFHNLDKLACACIHPTMCASLSIELVALYLVRYERRSSIVVRYRFLGEGVTDSENFLTRILCCWVLNSPLRNFFRRPFKLHALNTFFKSNQGKLVM